MPGRNQAAFLMLRLTTGEIVESSVKDTPCHFNICELHHINPDEVIDSGWRDPDGTAHWNEGISPSLKVHVCPRCDNSLNVQLRRVVFKFCLHCVRRN